MDGAAKRVAILAVLGVVVVGAALWMRETGAFRSAKARADEQFALSERAHHEGDFESAMKHMQKAVELDPQFVQAREGLAAMYEQHRGMDAAIAELERGIQEDPNNEGRYCYRIAEIYFINRQWEPALKWLKRADELDPEDLHIQRMIGFCLERQGRWREAEAHWTRLLAKDSNNPDVQRALARVRRHLNDTKGGKGG